MNESAAQQFGRLVMIYARERPAFWFHRFNVTDFLGAEHKDDTWTERKERAEMLLDVLVGAGLLIKDKHSYGLNPIEVVS